MRQHNLLISPTPPLLRFHYQRGLQQTRYLCPRFYSERHASTNREELDPDLVPGSDEAPQNQNLTGSAKLFADAAKEEDSASISNSSSTSAHHLNRSRLLRVQNQNENWTGEESIQDAVLRMLVDKYKPLRGGTIRSAEEKLKSALPRVLGSVGVVAEIDAEDDRGSLSSSSTSTTTSSTTATAATAAPPPPLQPLKTGSWSTEPLLPSSETHKPWHTEFKVPTHATSSIKLANIPPPRPLGRGPGPTGRADQRERKEKEATRREVVRRKEEAGRLGRARESMLDYKLGLGIGVKELGKGKGGGHVGARSNPVSMRGWTGLIEDRIEKARNAGVFDSIKGRGKPLVRESEERNPFIGREEFFMNRIVKRGGAAPPWVELQSELDSALTTLRTLLHQSYTRRAIRHLTSTTPAPLLLNLTLHDLRTRRDVEWEEKERAYHDSAVEEVNGLVRKYNGIAPYAVRRAYYLRSVEVGRVYEECAEEVLEGVRERVRGGNGMGIGTGGGGGYDEENGEAKGGGGWVGGREGYVGLKELVWRWFGRVFGRWR